MGHWYDRHGNPQYTVLKKDGEPRDTTLRDARKFGLVPSVTTITSVLDKPALVSWARNEVLDACLNNPFSPEDLGGIKEWKRFIINASNEKRDKSADSGIIIHDALEKAIKTGKIIKHKKIVKPVLEFLNSEFPEADWVAERSFTNLKHGFGGCVDLHCKKLGIVLDFKTKNKTKEEMEKVKAYDNHHMQSAAYTVGLNMSPQTSRYNLFIGYDDKLNFTGLNLTESEDFEREWGMFKKLLEFWKIKNKFDINEIIKEISNEL